LFQHILLYYIQKVEMTSKKFQQTRNISLVLQKMPVPIGLATLFTSKSIALALLFVTLTTRS